MENNEILMQVTGIFRDVLDDGEIVLNFQTTANDIENWDSISHIQLVVAIEKHFKIKFGSKEILAWENVGQMIDSIAGKI